MRRSLTACALALVSALSVAACAGGADDPVFTTGDGESMASSDYLAMVVDRAGDATYRYEADVAMATDLDGRSMDVDAERAVYGAVDGDLSSMTVDARELVQAMGGELPPDADLVMRTVSDDDQLYIKGGYFQALLDLAESRGAGRTYSAQLGSLADLSDDDWARVDLDGLTMAEIASTTGAQPAEPALFLDIASRGTGIEDLGTEHVDGVDVRGLSATATYKDMLVAQGIDLDEFRDGLADQTARSGLDIDEVYDSTLSIEIALEVWVDHDDRVRTVEMDLDLAPMLEALGGEDMTYAIGMTLHVTDYDDELIVIEIPEASVDVTDDYLRFSEARTTP